MKRRSFIKSVTLGSASAMLIPGLMAEHCSYTGNIPFSGEVVGETSTACHQFRDGFKPNVSRREEGNQYSVIIIGAGISGLSVAWHLFRQGVRDILILEQMGDPGGTSMSGSRDGFRFPWAAHYIETPPLEANHLFPLYEDLGIILGYHPSGWPIVNENYVVKQPEVKLFTSKGWINHRYPFPVATQKDLHQFDQFNQQMLEWFQHVDQDNRRAFTYPVEASSLNEAVRQLDTISMETYLNSLHLDSQSLIWYVDMQCRDNFGTGISETSAWVGIHYFSSNATDLHPGLSRLRPVETITWPEGNQFLVNGLTRQFQQNAIRCNSMVMALENLSDKVVVDYWDTKHHEMVRLQGKSVVIAAPKFIAARFYPKLNTPPYSGWQTFSYAPWLIANLLVDHPPETLDYSISWDTISMDTPSLGYVLSNFTDYRMLNKSKRPTVLTYYLPFTSNIDEARQDLLRKGWEHWTRFILWDLERMHPGISTTIQWLDIMKWGHPMIRPTPGYLFGETRRVYQEPDARVYFAHSDVAGIPTFEQITYQAFQTAKRMITDRVVES